MAAPTKNQTRSAAMRKLDRAFSIYIRTRDSQEFEGRQFRCISCGRILPIAQADAGHYINRTHMSLRYSEDNVHAQCRRCNRFDEGNMVGYRQGLIEKIGEQRLVLMEAQKYAKHKLSVAELLILADHYKQMTKQFKYQINGD